MPMHYKGGLNFGSGSDVDIGEGRGIDIGGRVGGIAEKNRNFHEIAIIAKRIPKKISKFLKCILRLCTK